MKALFSMKLVLFPIKVISVRLEIDGNWCDYLLTTTYRHYFAKKGFNLLRKVASIRSIFYDNYFLFSLQLFPGTFVNCSSFMENKTKIRSLSKTPKTFCRDGANGF